MVKQDIFLGSEVFGLVQSLRSSTGLNRQRLKGLIPVTHMANLK